MKVSKYLMAVAAASLATAPAFAAPINPAASLSVDSSVRAGGSSKHANKAASSGILIAVLAAAAVGAGIYVAVDNKDKPDSP